MTRVREVVQGNMSGQLSASPERLGEGVWVGETYPSDLWPSLPASPLTFWGSRQGRLQKETTWLWRELQLVTWSHERGVAGATRTPRSGPSHYSFSSVVTSNNRWRNGHRTRTICRNKCQKSTQFPCNVHILLQDLFSINIPQPLPWLMSYRNCLILFFLVLFTGESGFFLKIPYYHPAWFFFTLRVWVSYCFPH